MRLGSLSPSAGTRGPRATPRPSALRPASVLWANEPRFPSYGVQAAAPRSEPPPVSDPVASNPATRLEALLWAASEPLAPRRLARLLGLGSAAEVAPLVDELRRKLAARRSALGLARVAGGLRLATRPAVAPWLDRAMGPTPAPPVSSAGLEVLAIVASRQPVVRAEVEAVRGVACGELLRQLLEADLLRIVGRSGELGKPLLYGTTTRFLELYGLCDLGDLPRPDEGAATAGPTKQNAPQAMGGRRAA